MEAVSGNRCGRCRTPDTGFFPAWCDPCRAAFAEATAKDRRAPYSVWEHSNEETRTWWGPYLTIEEARSALAEIKTYPHGQHGAHIRDAYRERVPDLTPCTCNHRGPSHGPNGCEAVGPSRGPCPCRAENPSPTLIPTPNGG